MGRLVLTNFDIVPTALAVKAMRDNGYKNSAYALAELMDNSIQAGATRVELLCSDEELRVDQRVRQRLGQVAVLDNGCGMNDQYLQQALQFGNGSRLEAGKKSGMGRFGMGLPSASVSQCRRVDVWSWQEGPDTALHSYIDLDEIEKGHQTTIPTPEHRPVPELWLQAAQVGTFGATGTLVVWSQLDRCLWRTSRALIENSEELIGRMYRRWIVGQQVAIRLANFVVDKPKQHPIDRAALPNDPTYLMKGTSCPAPFDAEPMFAPFPDEQSSVRTLLIEHEGGVHEVKLTFSLARDSARQGGRNAGATPAGRHAARNMGVSVVRSGRELDLDTSFINGYDPTERWWGVEVAFEPGLDEVFGVANNKQSARNFSEAAKLNIDALIREHGGSIVSAQESLREQNSPIEPLLAIVHAIQTQLKVMRDRLKTQTASKERERHGQRMEALATRVVEERQRQGIVGRSDAGEKLPVEERVQLLAEELAAQGQGEAAAREQAVRTISSGFKYQVNDAPIEGGAFFSVQPRGGVLLVTLNTDHPAYELLEGARRPEDLPTDSAALREALEGAHMGLEMLLFAWARYEDEQSGESRDAAQAARYDWGRMARRFLAETGD